MPKKLLLITIFLLLALPIGSRAVEVTSVGNNLLAQVTPASPGPGEQVTISLTGYGFNIDASTITWSVNEVVKVRSIGNKSFSFNLGPIGQQTKVSVFVESRGGQNSSKTFIFDPAELELFWETQTSAPPFYQGKAMPSAGASLHFVAWPYLVNHAGQKIDPAQLTYRWKKDDTALADLSGVGKNSITINTTSGASQVKISVEALSLTDKITATKSLVISLVQPEIVFYEKKPLEGINYGQVFPAEYSLFNEEVTVRAEPYWLPLASNLLFKYSWTIDQSTVNSRPDDPLAITLRRSENTSGSNRINFSTQNKDLNFSNSFVIKYGNSLLKPQF